jgi:hypothetical protein
MLDFLLDLPAWVGVLIMTSSISLLGLCTAILSKRLLKSSITKEHEKIGRLLFRVTAGLIALLISLSYANERVNQSKIIDSLEEEASLIVNLMIGLDNLESPEANEVAEALVDYVELTIDEHWENIDSNPFFSGATNALIGANKLIYHLPAETIQEELQRNMLIRDANQLTKLMQIRIYSEHSLVPYLIFILIVALIFMWVFFSIYKLDFVALFFLSLYNIIIAILIYFIFVLSNPLIGPLKIDAHSFSIIKTKGMETKFK